MRNGQWRREGVKECSVAPTQWLQATAAAVTDDARAANA